MIIDSAFNFDSVLCNEKYSPVLGEYLSSQTSVLVLFLLLSEQCCLKNVFLCLWFILPTVFGSFPFVLNTRPTFKTYIVSKVHYCCLYRLFSNIHTHAKYLHIIAEINAGIVCLLSVPEFFSSAVVEPECWLLDGCALRTARQTNCILHALLNVRQHPCKHVPVKWLNLFLDCFQRLKNIWKWFKSPTELIENQHYSRHSFLIWTNKKENMFKCQMRGCQH